MKGELDSSAVDHLIGYLLAVAEIPSRRVFQRRIGGAFKLRPAEFTLLLLLLRNAGATPKRLTQALQLQAPQVTLLIDRLVERKLVERKRSGSDGRVLEVSLTAAGDRLARKVHEQSLSIEDDWLAVLSAAERAMLRELLLKLARSETGD